MLHSFTRSSLIALVSALVRLPEAESFNGAICVIKPTYWSIFSSLTSLVFSEFVDFKPEISASLPLIWSTSSLVNLGSF